MKKIIALLILRDEAMDHVPRSRRLEPFYCGLTERVGYVYLFFGHEMH